MNKGNHILGLKCKYNLLPLSPKEFPSLIPALIGQMKTFARNTSFSFSKMCLLDICHCLKLRSQIKGIVRLVLNRLDIHSFIHSQLSIECHYVSCAVLGGDKTVMNKMVSEPPKSSLPERKPANNLMN